MKPNIVSILSHEFTGNYSIDCTAFLKIEKFIKDDSNSMLDRVFALKHILVDGTNQKAESYEFYESLVRRNFQNIYF